jgi:hypothetical protein
MSLITGEVDDYGAASTDLRTAFSMVKRKFGDSLRSKTDTAMVNEVLAKIVCHNVCCLISAWYELGIAPELRTANSDEVRDVIPFSRPG